MGHRTVNSSQEALRKRALPSQCTLASSVLSSHARFALVNALNRAFSNSLDLLSVVPQCGVILPHNLSVCLTRGPSTAFRASCYSPPSTLRYCRVASCILCRIEATLIQWIQYHYYKHAKFTVCKLTYLPTTNV